ncbi:MAG: hypothetical protein WCO78_02480 [Candidatus Roizmanbacteria bacterium]
MDKSISEVIRYYGVQGRRMTSKDILRYSNISFDTQTLDRYLNTAVRDGVCSFDLTTQTYADARQNIPIEQYQKRSDETARKLSMLRTFFALCRSIPTISMIGLTGSCSINNARPDDDIDLMIITSTGRIFTTRLIVSCIALLLGLKHARGAKHDPDKVCLNLWLDDSDLAIPSSKVCLYSAREIAQLHVLFDRNNSYDRLLEQNQWVKRYLPNFISSRPVRNTTPLSSHHSFFTHIIDILERVARFFQLKQIKRHLTREYVTDTQLWFHPIDRTQNEV